MSVIKFWNIDGLANQISATGQISVKKNLIKKWYRPVS